MRILFNDEPLKCDDGLTISALLDKLRQLKPGTALALNQQILPREQWDHQQVRDGDNILLFQVIVGG
ncbi:sulfur carrier protein ThiS [Enterobacter soli]|uniref:sulfur carrier protein ThiS n=1 Tax=Enterobacter soli TaxID=885040 RepID=UPI003EDA2F04